MGYKIVGDISLYEIIKAGASKDITKAYDRVYYNKGVCEPLIQSCFYSFIKWAGSHKFLGWFIGHGFIDNVPTVVAAVGEMFLIDHNWYLLSWTNSDLDDSTCFLMSVSTGFPLAGVINKSRFLNYDGITLKMFEELLGTSDECYAKKVLDTGTTFDIHFRDFDIRT